MAELRNVRKGINPSKSLSNFVKDKKVLPLIIANTAKNHFVSGFREGGGKTDKSRNGWKSRTFDQDQGRATLVKSGVLRRDIKVKSAVFGLIKVGTSSLTQDYAEAHNKGATITVTEKQRKYFAYKAATAKTKEEKQRWGRMINASKIDIPQRQYIGRSTELMKKISILIIRRIRKTWKHGR